MEAVSVRTGVLREVHILGEFGEPQWGEVTVVPDVPGHIADFNVRVSAEQAALLIPLVGKPVKVTMEVKVEAGGS